MARHQLAVGDDICVLVLVRDGVHLTHDAGHLHGSEIVRGTKGRIDERETRVEAGVKAYSIIGDERGAHPVEVGITFGNVLGVRLPVVMDQTPVGAELKGVVAFDPGDIIDEVVHRHVGKNRVGDPDGVVQATQSVEVLIVESDVSQALADESIAKIVDQVVANDPGIASGDPFAVVGKDLVGRQAGKLWRLFLLSFCRFPRMNREWFPSAVIL